MDLLDNWIANGPQFQTLLWISSDQLHLQLYLSVFLLFKQIIEFQVISVWKGDIYSKMDITRICKSSVNESVIFDKSLDDSNSWINNSVWRVIDGTKFSSTCRWNIRFKIFRCLVHWFFSLKMLDDSIWKILTWFLAPLQRFYGLENSREPCGRNACSSKRFLWPLVG